MPDGLRPRAGPRASRGAAGRSGCAGRRTRRRSRSARRRRASSPALGNERERGHAGADLLPVGDARWQVIPSTANVAMPAGRPESRISGIPVERARRRRRRARRARATSTSTTCACRSTGNMLRQHEVLLLGAERQDPGEVGADRDEADVAERDHARVADEDVERDHDRRVRRARRRTRAAARARVCEPTTADREHEHRRREQRDERSSAVLTRAPPTRRRARARTGRPGRSSSTRITRP